MNRASKDYGRWAAEVAKSEGVAFVDLNDIVAKHYEEAGKSKVESAYFTTKDHTHTTEAGARLNAASVAEVFLDDCSAGGPLSGALKALGGSR